LAIEAEAESTAKELIVEEAKANLDSKDEEVFLNMPVTEKAAAIKEIMKEAEKVEEIVLEIKKEAKRKTDEATVAKETATIIAQEATEAKEVVEIKKTEAKVAKEVLATVEAAFNDDITNDTLKKEFDDAKTVFDTLETVSKTAQDNFTTL
jgi:hypothetical protein